MSKLSIAMKKLNQKMRQSVILYGMSLLLAQSHVFAHSTSPILNVPELSSSVGFLAQQQERLIGEKVYRQIHKQMPVVQDVWLEEEMMVVFSHLLAQSQLGEPIALFIINDPQINAFAVPGGVFALNTGLLFSAKSMGEVAGVMAHEIAHVSQRHYSRSKESFKGQGLLTLAGILVGAVAVSQGEAEAGSAVLMGSQALMMNRQLSYSREQEREADRVGMQYLFSAGYDPHHMANFFETMHRSSPQIGFLPDFWLTHPLTTERMSEARLRANQYPKIKEAWQNVHNNFQLIQYYSRVLSNKISETELKQLSQQDNPSATLALSAHYLKKNEWQLAQNALNKIKKEYYQHVLFNLIQVDVLIAQKKYHDALNLIQQQVKIMPENRSLNYKLAEIYIQLNQGQQAYDILTKFTHKYPRDIQLWRLLQQASSKNTTLKSEISTILVLRYRAEMEFWSGFEEQGIKSLLHAQRLAKESHNQWLIAQIDSRLKQMQDEHKTKI